MCTKCGLDREVVLPALGHEWATKVYTGYANCEHYGVFYWVCSRCGAHSDTGNDKPLGHDWDEGVVTKAPTATEDGVKTYTCKRDPSHTKTEVIPATGEEEKPELTVTVWAEDFYHSHTKKSEYKVDEYATFRGAITNTGNVDIELHDCDDETSFGYSVSGVNNTGMYYLLKPGETVIDWNNGWFLGLHVLISLGIVTPGTETETLAGTITYTGTVRGYRPGTDEVLCSDTASCTIGVLKPEEAEPGLTIKWDYDEIFHHDSTSATTEITTEPGILALNDGACVWFTVTNTGDVPLKVIQYFDYGDGWNGKKDYSTLSPSASVQEMNYTPVLKEFLTPGTETDELFGTVTVSLYCAGYDPETYSDTDDPGEELCRTETITRTWMVGKDKGSGSGDHCALTLETLGYTEANYILHTCPEHLGTAEEAEKLSASGDWAGAAELWTAEIEKLYGKMAEAIGERADDALKEDREAFFEYAQAVRALFGDEEAAELLRLRCAGMCCVMNSSPIMLPQSLLGEYETPDASGSFLTSGREIGVLDGSDCEVKEKYAGFAAEAMAETRALLGNAADGQADGLFANAAGIWKSALDEAVNAAYKKADKNVKPLIAGWNMSLGILGDADGELYSLFYRSAPETAEELVMDLYRDAALLLGGMD